MPTAGTGLEHYEDRGHGYAQQRVPDPRIAAAIIAALGAARTVLNVGAGTGSYEPGDRHVVALDPSTVMLAQRTSPAPRVRGAAEALPFADGAFDAAMAVLTIHHWHDWRRGLAELRRVARCAAILTVDIEAHASFWLLEYFPTILADDRRRMPPCEAVVAELGGSASVVPVPADCVDGFLGAFWRRPEVYLDLAARSAMSGFAAVPNDELASGLRRLRDDLASGAWAALHGTLLTRESFDVGYRLLVSDRRHMGAPYCLPHTNDRRTLTLTRTEG